MKPTVFILCRRKARGNQSAMLERELLLRGINCYRVTSGVRPRYSPERVRVVINYGNSTTPVWADDLPEDVVWLNSCDVIPLSANKVRMFWEFSDNDIPCLDYTTSIDTAAWWVGQGHTAVCRTTVTGSKGRGIVFCNQSGRSTLPEAPLYTKLWAGSNIKEFRTFMLHGIPFLTLQKKRYRSERLAEHGIERNFMTDNIRTNGNGWVFAHKNHDINIDRELQRAFEDWPVAYGAIDYLVDMETGEWKAIEWNTVPAILDRNTRAAVADRLAQFCADVDLTHYQQEVA